jgi:hypothetical protein
MPVYKKCYDTWIQFHKNNQRCADIFQDIWQALWKCNIEECHSEIVDFIEWFNSEQSVKESDTTKAT